MRQHYVCGKKWILSGLLAAAACFACAQADDVVEFKAAEVNAYQLQITLKYRYASDHGDQVQLSCVPLVMRDGKLQPDYANFRRARTQAVKGGDFRAVIDLVYTGGKTIKSEQIRVIMKAVGQSAAFFRKDFDQVKVWGAPERVKPIQLGEVDLSKEAAKVWQKTRATVARAAHLLKQKNLSPELLVPVRSHQYRAQQLYTSNNFNAAVAHSLYARELAREIIKGQGGQAGNADLTDAREEALAQYTSPAELKAAVKGMKLPAIKPDAIPEDAPQDVQLIHE